MKVKLITPDLAPAMGPLRRPIKYSLFPPIGLATLAGYLREDDEVTLQDENVERLNLDDEPDLVGIQTYFSSARRAYEIAAHYRAKGAHVALGGLHVTAMPQEAIRHADTIFLGPGEDTWPAFLRDFRAGCPGRVYRSTVRTLANQPPVRRDLIKRHLYLAPNSLVVSRGCPHACDFCTNQRFFRGGRSFYTQTVDQALAEIARLPGRHLYFLDDQIFGNREFARALFDAMRGMGKVWQAAGTVEAALDEELLGKAVEAGLRSLLVGFETLNAGNLRAHRKYQNLRSDYDAAVRCLHDLGVMVNATFVFGMDQDDETVFDRTVEWAVEQGIETATFHILTPFPGTAVYERMVAEGRILTRNWDLYDTFHVVYRPARMSPAQLKAGYLRAYRDFYRWGSILKSARAQVGWRARLRHVAYAVGWRKCDPLWKLIVRAKRVGACSQLLETVLAAASGPAAREAREARPKPVEVGLPLHRRLQSRALRAATSRPRQAVKVG